MVVDWWCPNVLWQGLLLMCGNMKRERVFLAIDNVTNENNLWKEAYEYLGVGFPT